MIYFFGKPSTIIYAVQIAKKLKEIDQKKLAVSYTHLTLPTKRIV